MSFENIRPEEIFRQKGSGSGILIDLRNRRDYSAGHIPEAICIPYEELQQSIPDLKRRTEQCRKQFGNAVIIVYCDRGNTSIRAARDLYSQGFSVKNVYGGISAYKGPRVYARKHG